MEERRGGNVNRDEPRVNEVEAPRGGDVNRSGSPRRRQAEKRGGRRLEVDAATKRHTLHVGPNDSSGWRNPEPRTPNPEP